MAGADQSRQNAPEVERCFAVPAINVLYFVGRESLFEKIDGYLQNVETAKDCTKIVIPFGMGDGALLSSSADQG